jgi:hypothetical protein
MKYKFFTVIILLLPVGLFAMSAKYQAQQCRLYQNVEMTPENLYMLSKKMPGTVQKEVNQWAKEKKHFFHDLISLTKDTVTDKNELNHIQTEFQKKIASAQMVNASETNAAFQINFSNQPWMIKFVGPQRRAHAILSANNLENENNLTNELPRKPTYMTASQVAGYLRAIETIESKNLNKFKAPLTCLAQIPERTSIEAAVNDENCFVVQEYMPNTKRLDENPDIIARIDEETLYQLYSIIKAVPLWDAAANMLFDTSDDCFTTFDFEQSWEEPNKFFNRNTNFVKSKINSGIEDLGLLIKLSAKTGHDLTELHKNFIKLVQNDDYFQKLRIPEIIKKTFIL